MARALSDYPELARYMDAPGPDPKDVGRNAARGGHPGPAEEEPIGIDEIHQEPIPHWMRAAMWMARETLSHDPDERAIQAEHHGRIVHGWHVHDTAHARRAAEREDVEAER